MALDDSDISIKIGIDDTQAVADVKKSIDALKLQLAQLKATPEVDTKQIQAAQAQAQALTVEIKKLSQSQSVNIDTKSLATAQNALNTITKGLEGLGKPTALNIVATQANKELEALNSKLSVIKNITATELILKFGEIGLDIIGETLAKIKEFTLDAINVSSELEVAQAGLNNTLQAQAVNQNAAVAAFQSGKGTLQDYATITGTTVEALQHEEKATGGVAKASKGLKEELLKLKEQKQALDNPAQKEIKTNETLIKTIDQTVRGLKEEEEAKLKSANATDQIISKEDLLIKNRERALNKEVSDATRTFERDNAGKILDNKKQQLTIEKQIGDITDQEKANKGNTVVLATLKTQKDALQEQLDTLKEQKSQIDLNKESILTEIEIRQNASRQELADQQAIVDQKKATNQSIKDDFANQIQDYQKQIDDLKTQIEDRKIKLDADISPITDKIQIIQDQISNLAVSASGGGGSKLVTDPAALKKINDLNKNGGGGLQTLSKEDQINRGKEIVSKVNALSDVTPYTASQQEITASLLTQNKFDVLAGTQGGKSIKEAGSENILNVVNDLISNKTLTGSTYEGASQEVIRALQEIKSGAGSAAITRNLKIGRSVIGQAITDTGLEKAVGKGKTGETDLKGLENLDPAQLTKLLARATQIEGIAGQTEAFSKTLKGEESTLQSKFQNVERSFLGNADDQNSLFSEIKKIVENLTKTLDDPAIKKTFKDLGDRIALFLSEAITPTNIQKFAQAIEGFFNFVSQALSPENIQKIVNFANKAGEIGGNVINTLGGLGDKSTAQGFVADKAGAFINEVTGGNIRDQAGKAINNIQSFDQNNLGGGIGKTLNNIGAATQGNTSSLGDQFNTTKKTVEDFFIKQLPDYTTTALNNVAKFFSDLKDQAVNKFIELGATVNKFFTQDIPYAVGQAVGEVIKQIYLLPENFEKAKNTIFDLAGQIGTFVSGKFDEISKAVQKFATVDVPNFISGLPKKFSDLGESIKKGVIDGFQAISNFVFGGGEGDKKQGNLFEKIGNVGETAANKIGDAFKGLGTAIQKALIDAVKGAIAPINSFIDGINDKLSAIPNFQKIGKLNTDLLEGKAIGGSVNANQPYLVGEKGPEVVSFDRSGFITPNDVLQNVMGQVQNTYNQQKQVTYSPTFNNNINATGSSNIDSAYTANMNGSQYDSILKYGF